jgi:uncharacterized protein with HEPN domain
MSRRDWSLFVADMQEAIEKIASYVDAMTFTDFQSDTRTVDAVVHNLLVIGEAARCLPASIKENHPDIDWIAINGLRNRIAHEYFGLSLSVIWEIVQRDLPRLQQQRSPQPQPVWTRSCASDARKRKRRLAAKRSRLLS